MTPTLFTAAIILGSLSILIILFILLHKKGRNKKMAMQKVVIADIIWKNKLEVAEQETINSYFLALDLTNFVLLYINFSDIKEQVVLIDLWEIQTIKVTTDYNSVYEQKKGKSILVDKQVNKLQLEVTFGNAQPKLNLALYEYKDGFQNFAEIKSRADHWCQLINKALKELPHPSRRDSKEAYILSE